MDVSKLRKGSVLRDINLDPPWNLLIVQDFTITQSDTGLYHTKIVVKRPVTHEGKTFVIFLDDEYSFPSDLLPPELQLERI